jgi:NAD(P)-dependent dehydrogenase (short-subunit alcohol dehydrogenase family)
VRLTGALESLAGKPMSDEQPMTGVPAKGIPALTEDSPENERQDNLAGRIALVTGANRGLGFEISRQLGRKGIIIVAGAREGADASSTVERLKSEGIDAHSVILDVTAPSAVDVLPTLLEVQFGGLDILVNNAGVQFDAGVNPSELETEILRTTFEINVFGAFAVTQALLPLIRKSSFGRIVNMSSSLGSLAAIGDPTSPFYEVVCPAYQASKAALNALTVLFAKELKNTAVKVNSACPGWVRTELGTERAPLSVEEGADTPVWLATLPADGPTGGFFNSRKPTPW